MPNSSDNNPATALGHVRVIEIGDIVASYTTRWLADLGADVIKVEPPGGDPSRRLPPFAAGVEDPERSLTFINANTNKRSIVLDLANNLDDRKIFASLLTSANLLVEATPVGWLEEIHLTDERIERDYPGLATVSLTPFGRTGPNRHCKGSDAIANASGGFLFAQGDDKKAPCTAPAHLAYQIAAAVAAVLAIAGIRHSRRTGAGQRLDISLQEALTFTNSSSIARYSRENRLEKRPGTKDYGGTGTNIYRCKDGKYVHFTANRPHMWREFTQNWMTGTILSGPEWENQKYREAHQEQISGIFAEFIGQFSAEEFAAEAQRRHLAAAPLNTIGEFINSDHVRSRQWLQQLEHPVIGRYTAPGFPMRFSLTPMRVRRPAPLIDQHREEILAELKAIKQRPALAPRESQNTCDPMLDGIRVADLTQQFAGPLGTEMLAYYGAEVIKVESETVPVGGRAGVTHADMNRAKLGCTINLRDADGKKLLAQLAANCNVIVDNFSAGVMERLGFGFDDLRQINPGIVQAVMPGWGLTGPLKSWVAWGWQLLAYNGIMALWGYPDSPMQSRCKIAWPDRTAAVTMAIGVIAAIEYQERTGEGQFIEAAMLEAQGAMMGPAILDYTVNGADWKALGYDEILGAPYAPYGCYPCRGDDAWIIIACESDSEWANLVELIGKASWAADDRFAGKADRKKHGKELDRHLAEWTKRLSPRLAFRLLQKAGVPAGIPMSGEDLYYDIHLRERGHIVETDAAPWGKTAHHGLPGIPSLSAADAARPAPWIGAHNDYIFGKILGMSSEEIGVKKSTGAIK